MKRTDLARLLSAAATGLALLTGQVCNAQPAPAPAPAAAAADAGTVDAATRTDLVTAIVDAMQAHYIYPDMVPRVRAALADPARAAALAAQPGGEAYARALTDALQELTRDKHVRVRYSPMPLPVRAASGKPTAEEEAAFRREAQMRNFDVERVERLPGNIGYLELRGFMPASMSEEAITAAMTLLAHTDALIVDLRRNGGGSPGTVALVCSYLFEQRTHLNDLVWRDGTRDEFWTRETLKGPRYGARKPVWVLTSSRTFSGAEEFSYNMRNLQRATLVGETTAGGANPGGVHRLTDHYSMFVPSGRAVSPVTGTSWEGTGVEPHVPVPAADALRVAQLQALAALLPGTTDERMQAGMRERITELEQQAVPGPVGKN